MNQRLQLGGFLAFSEHLSKPYSWGGDPRNTTIDDSFDIQTPFVDLEGDRTIVTATPVRIVDPHGTSAQWGVEILNKEVVGDTNDAKTLRVYFRVVTHGGATVTVATINFFGMIFAGVTGSSIDFNS